MTPRTTRLNFKTISNALLVFAMLLICVSPAQAVLNRVGPIDVPSPPGHGFPLWYQDTNGLALDLCLPKDQIQLDAGVCLILPGDITSAPPVFPGNFTAEAFWWNATVVGDLNANGDQALLVLALEAAFSTGEIPDPGAQVAFGRVRIRIDAPVAGTYTVTHPYGVKVFPNVQPGIRTINDTSDIGIGNPGDFTGALQSAVGPFLRAAVGAPGGPASPLVTISGDQFLSDAVAPVFVTGSPQNTNFFQICVDNPGGLDGNPATLNDACQTFNQFTLVGKVHTAPIASPLTLDRATYGRSDTAVHVNVSANATAGPGAAAPRLFFGDAAGTRLMPSKLMNGPTELGEFFGQSIPPRAAALPASVIVTNVGDNPPSSVTQSLVDAVTITQALYNPANGRLTIVATSSDKGLATAIPPIGPPQLFAIGLPGSPASVPFLPAPTAADPARQQLVYTLPAAGVLRVPPLEVSVTSSVGGLDTEVVNTFVAGGSFAGGGPIAIDDTVSVAANSGASVPVPVLSNDAGPFNRASVRFVTQPQNGTLTLNTVTGVITYTFINPLLVGNDSFTYTVTTPAGVESNVATATVTITP